MARHFSDALKDRIRRDTDLVALLSHFGVHLQLRGDIWEACCPFHGEKTPSFKVSILPGGRPNAKCFGGCGKSYDAFAIAMQLGKMTFRQAATFLCERLGIHPDDVGGPSSSGGHGPRPQGGFGTPPPDPEAAAQAARDDADRQDLRVLHQRAAAFFRDQLEKNPAAIAYCEGRGFDARAREKWGIGYVPAYARALADHLRPLYVGPDGNPDTWHRILRLGAKTGLFSTKRKASVRDLDRCREAVVLDPDAALAALEAARAQSPTPLPSDGDGGFPAPSVPPPPTAADFERYGVLLDYAYDDGWLFADRIAFPIHDADGEIVAFSCRIWTARQAADPKASKYRNSKTSVLYQKNETVYGFHHAREALRDGRAKEAVIVEGQADVIACHTLGVPGAVALLSASASLPQLQLLRAETDRLVLLLDHDDAGRDCGRRTLPPALGLGFDVHVTYFPADEGVKDAGDVLTRCAHASARSGDTIDVHTGDIVPCQPVFDPLVAGVVADAPTWPTWAVESVAWDEDPLRVADLDFLASCLAAFPTDRPELTQETVHALTHAHPAVRPEIEARAFRIRQRKPMRTASLFDTLASTTPCDDDARAEAGAAIMGGGEPAPAPAPRHHARKRRKKTLHIHPDDVSGDGWSPNPPPPHLVRVDDDAPERPVILNRTAHYDENADGESEKKSIAWRIDDMVDLLFRERGNDIGRLGGNLFVVRPPSDAIENDVVEWLGKPENLFAWIKSWADVEWDAGADIHGKQFVKRDEFFVRVVQCARPYATVTGHPFWPVPDDTFVRWTPDPKRVPDGSALDAFCAFFNPDSPVDAALLRTMVLTMFWGGRPGQRPLFVIAPPGDGGHLQGIGKTTLAESVASLAGRYMQINRPTKAGFGDSILKQAVEEVNRTARAAILDNTTGVLRDDDLAKIITAREISARGSFAKQSCRSNRIVWMATTNELSLASDLASRAVILRLGPKPPDADPHWGDRLDAFIRDHGHAVADDCIALLRSGARHPVTAPMNRDASWVADVLALSPLVNECLLAIHDANARANADADEAAAFMDVLHEKNAGDPPPLDADQVIRLKTNDFLPLWRIAFPDDNSPKINTISRIIRVAIDKGLIRGLSRCRNQDERFWEWRPAVYRKARGLPHPRAVPPQPSVYDPFDEDMFGGP